MPLHSPSINIVSGRFWHLLGTFSACNVNGPALHSSSILQKTCVNCRRFTGGWCINSAQHTCFGITPYGLWTDLAVCSFCMETCLVLTVIHQYWKVHSSLCAHLVCSHHDGLHQLNASLCRAYLQSNLPMQPFNRLTACSCTAAWHTDWAQSVNLSINSFKKQN